MTELPPRVRAQVDAAVRRRVRRDRARAALEAAREEGLKARQATRLGRATETCTSCGVPLGDGSTHWPWCNHDNDDDEPTDAAQGHGG
jgi:hypothetical protein